MEIGSRLKGAVSRVVKALLEFPFFLFEHCSIFSPISIFLAGIFASVGAQLLITPPLYEAPLIRTSRLILSAVLFFTFSGVLFWIGLELEGFTKKLSKKRFEFANDPSPSGRKIRWSILQGKEEKEKEFTKFPPLHRVGFAILIGFLSLIFAFAFLYHLL